MGLLSLLSFFAVLEEVMGSNATTMTTTTSKLSTTVTVAGGSTKAPGGGPGSNMSTTAAGSATKTVKGTVQYKVGTRADCDKLKASTKYATELCKKIVGWMGLDASDAKKCKTTTSCSKRR